MDLSKGTRLGPYEIVGLIGKGGMGEVYRAEDTRLNRTVAIKVLSEADPQRQERFKREAKAVSSLNHPHICTLHDVGEDHGTHFLVMEYLAGETLTQRLQKGRLPLNQSLQFAIEIADALEKAHRQGVVHRDLKPGNIMITKSGVKLLDFGLAKLTDPAVPSSMLSALPTRHSATPFTQEGTILGTLQYMAPEQLEGAETDARADIFAFGTVLYEMVTGTKAFAGKSQASLIGAIMHSDPKSILELEQSTPTALDHIVKRCLAKDPDDRWQSAGDLRHELMWIAQGERPGRAVPATLSPSVVRSTRAALWILPGIIAGGLVGGLVTWKAAPSGELPQRPLRQFAITPATPLLTNAGSLLGLSPSGDTLIYTGFPQSGGRQLYRHSMDQVDDVAIPGTDWGDTTTAGQSAAPFFSPDGKWVAFQSRGSLKKVLLAGGPVSTVAQRGYRGGSWGDDDVIVLGTAFRGGLLRVNAKGGEPTQMLAPKPDEGMFVYPQILPGGDAVLFTVSEERLTGHLEILMTKTGERRRLLDGFGGRVVPSGHLVFFRAGSIWAVRFDSRRLVTVGEPVPVVERVRSEIEGYFQFTVSDDGTLAYIPDPGAAVDRTLVWVDQKGQEQPTKASPATYAWARVSPDGRQVAVQLGNAESSDIGVVDLETGFLTRLTNRAGMDAYPLWTRDGQRIVFASDRTGSIELLSMAPDGTGEIKRLAAFKDALVIQPQGWSEDGTQLVFLFITRGNVDVWRVRADGQSQPEPLLNSDGVEQTPGISPNGKWIAYSSNETGRDEIFVQRFPELGLKRRISTDGGMDPMWSPDGRKLYYHASPPTKMMVVSTNPDTGAKVGEAQVLFERQYFRPVPGTRTHSISKDGTRLLMIKSAKPSTAADRIHIMVNWFDELRRLLPAGN